MRTRVYNSRILTAGFRCGRTENEYSPLWPKKYVYKESSPTVLNTGEFSREWCYDARKAIQIENGRLLKETGRCSWSSGDYVTMPSKYYKNEL